MIFNGSWATGLKQVPESGGSPVAVTTAEPGTSHLWPYCVPDGMHVLFRSRREYPSRAEMVYAVSIDGGMPVKLPVDRAGLASLSPDGTQIAFTSHRDGNAELYIINNDGSGVRRVTECEERDDYPAWHPSGERLLAVCERNGEHDLYLIDLP